MTLVHYIAYMYPVASRLHITPTYIDFVDHYFALLPIAYTLWMKAIYTVSIIINLRAGIS